MTPWDLVVEKEEEKGIGGGKRGGWFVSVSFVETLHFKWKWAALISFISKWQQSTDLLSCHDFVGDNMGEKRGQAKVGQMYIHDNIYLNKHHIHLLEISIYFVVCKHNLGLLKKRDLGPLRGRYFGSSTSLHHLDNTLWKDVGIIIIPFKRMDSFDINYID